MQLFYQMVSLPLVAWMYLQSRDADLYQLSGAQYLLNLALQVPLLALQVPLLVLIGPRLLSLAYLLYVDVYRKPRKITSRYALRLIVGPEAVKLFSKASKGFIILLMEEVGEGKNALAERIEVLGN